MIPENLSDEHSVTNGSGETHRESAQNTGSVFVSVKFYTVQASKMDKTMVVLSQP